LKTKRSDLPERFEGSGKKGSEDPKRGKKEGNGIKQNRYSWDLQRIRCSGWERVMPEVELEAYGA